MKMRILIAVLATFAGLSVQAGVVAAWDFNGLVNDTATAGWTSFSNGANNAVTVTFTGDEYLGDGDVTLTQAATGSGTSRIQIVVSTFEAAPALFSAASTEMNDGFDLVGTQDFTLSGLVENQAYRLQFIGNVNHNGGGNLKANRDLKMTVDGQTALLFPDDSVLTIAQVDGAYSEYVTYTADALGRISVLFGEENAGTKAVGGLIVETVPEPATVGLFALFGGGIFWIRRRIAILSA